MNGDRGASAEVGGAYERPAIRDLGSLTELTQATGFVGSEDGANKLLIHHVSSPSQP